MLLSRLFLLRENYTTINLTPMFRADTPVEQSAHTVSSEMLTPVRRNLQFVFITISGLIYNQSFIRILPLYISLLIALLQAEVNRYANLVGGLNAIIYSVVYLHYNLYAMAAYALIVSFPLQIVTFILWNKQPWQNSTVLKRFSNAKRAILIIGTIIAWGIICYFLSGTDSSHKELDTAVTVEGVVETVLTLFSYLEYTVFTFAGTVFSTLLYVMMLKDTPEQMTYLGYSVYSMICTLVALINANNIYREQNKLAKSQET